MNDHFLQEANWKSIEDAKIKIAILPWGATEAHNYHLPYGTDTIVAERISCDAAAIANKKKAGTIVLPPIAYGVNTGQIDVKLCMNLNPSTQHAILSDILYVLDSHGIDKLVIVNGHGGNNFQQIIRELTIEYPDIMICSVDWWKICDEKSYFDEPGDHAGELETSVMQAIRPELVSPLEEAGEGRVHNFKIEGLREKWVWTPRRWICISDDTGVGNPKMATAERGEKFFSACVEKLSTFLIDFSKVKSEDELYED